MATDTFAGSGNLTSPWTVVAGSFNQTGGAVYGNTGATSSLAVYTTGGVIGDQEASVTMNPRGSGQFIGPAVRGSSSAFTCANVDSGADGLYISYWVAGTQTVVVGPLTAPAAGTVINLRATGTGAGNQLRLYFDSVEQTGSGSPWTVGTNIPNTGYTGITAYSNGTTTGATDWTGTDLTPAPSVGIAAETEVALALDGIDQSQAEDLFIFGDDTGNESSMGGLKLFGGYRATGSNVPTGRGDETDSALALAGKQIATHGFSIETDAALALLGVQVRAVGISLETNSALALSAPAGSSAGLATETDTALPRGSARPSGLSAETDTALATAGLQIRAPGLSTETDAALARTAVQIKAPGLAAETNSALALSGVNGSGVGIANETDTALPRGSARPAGLSAESDSALGLAAILIRAAGQAAETDVALALSAIHKRQVGLAIETDTALQLTVPGALSVGMAVEIDAALSLSQAILPTWPDGGRDRIGPKSGVAGQRIGTASGTAGSSRIGSGTGSPSTRIGKVTI